jgi:photosystem II stability/assembly factor-like uncharacterized protein
MKIGAGKIIACLGMVMLFAHWSSAQWMKINLPYNEGITVRTLGISGNSILAGSDRNGIFRSNDSGTSWVESNIGLKNEGIISLAVSNGNIIAGTSSGVFISTDNGSTWSAATSGPENVVVYSIASSGKNVFAGTELGIYRSVNNGISWGADTSGPANLDDVQVLAFDGKNVLVGTYDQGLIRSSDTGKSWKLDSSGIASYPYVSALLIEGDIAFADLFSNGNNGGVFRSTDSGKSWIPANAGLPDSSTIYAFVLSGSQLFAGFDSSVYRSLDSGQTWSLVNSGGGGNAFAVGGNRIMAGGIGGFRSSTDGGTTWTPHNIGLNTYAVNSFLVWGNIILTCAIDDEIYSEMELNGNDVYIYPSEGIFRSINNGNTWTEVNAGGGSDLVVSGRAVFAAGMGLYSSKDSGTTWTAIDTSGLGKTFSVLLANKTYLFAGGSSGIVGDSDDVTLFRSADGGNSWVNIFSGLPRTQLCDANVCQWYYYYIQSLLAIGNTLFAATSLSAPPAAHEDPGQIYRSMDSGLTWSLSSAGLADTVQCIATNGSILFAGTANSGVFISRDTGTTWTASSSGLTNKNIQALFSTGADLFAGTHGGGIFHSADSGKTWTQFNNGLTDSSIQSFGVNDTYLFAGVGPGTYGGSVWRYPLSQVSVKRAQQIRPELASLKVHSTGRYNPAVSIDFSIPSPEKVSIGIYDLSGHLVTKLDDKLFTAGQHTLQWNARNAGSGCYVVRMQAGESVQVRAVPLVR